MTWERVLLGCHRNAEQAKTIKLSMSDQSPKHHNNQKSNQRFLGVDSKCYQGTRYVKVKRGRTKRESFFCYFSIFRRISKHKALNSWHMHTQNTCSREQADGETDELPRPTPSSNRSWSTLYISSRSHICRHDMLDNNQPCRTDPTLQKHDLM